MWHRGKREKNSCKCKNELIVEKEYNLLQQISPETFLTQAAQEQQLLNPIEEKGLTVNQKHTVSRLERAK
jgi:hypothetical protein